MCVHVWRGCKVCEGILSKYLFKIISKDGNNDTGKKVCLSAHVEKNDKSLVRQILRNP